MCYYIINCSVGRSPAPLPPRRDPKTTLSVGRARARSMVVGATGDYNSLLFLFLFAHCHFSLGFGEIHYINLFTISGFSDGEDDTGTGKSSSAESIHGSGPVQPRTASIRARPTSSRITAAELEELFQRQNGNSSSIATSTFQVCKSDSFNLVIP